MVERLGRQGPRSRSVALEELQRRDRTRWVSLGGYAPDDPDLPGVLARVKDGVEPGLEDLGALWARTRTLGNGDLEVFAARPPEDRDAGRSEAATAMRQLKEQLRGIAPGIDVVMKPVVPSKRSAAVRLVLDINSGAVASLQPLGPLHAALLPSSDRESTQLLVVRKVSPAGWSRAHEEERAVEQHLARLARALDAAAPGTFVPFEFAASGTTTELRAASDRTDNIRHGRLVAFRELGDLDAKRVQVAEEWDEIFVSRRAPGSEAAKPKQPREGLLHWRLRDSPLGTWVDAKPYQPEQELARKALVRRLSTGDLADLMPLDFREVTRDGEVVVQVRRSTSGTAAAPQHPARRHDRAARGSGNDPVQPR